MILNKLLSYYNFNNDNILEFSKLSFLILPNILFHTYYNKNVTSKYGIYLNIALLTSSSFFYIYSKKNIKEYKNKSIMIDSETEIKEVKKLEEIDKKVIFNSKIEEKIKMAESIISVNKFDVTGINDETDNIEIFYGINNLYELSIKNTEIYLNIYFENLEKAIKFREFVYDEYKKKENILDLYNQDKFKDLYKLFLNSNYVMI